MKPEDYSNYGLAQELLRLRTHAPELMAEAAKRLAALAQPAPGAAIAAREQEVTEDFSRWARHWFGSEADPKSIAKAIACMPIPTNAEHTK